MAEQNFNAFVKQSVGIAMTFVAAAPSLADYLKIMSPIGTKDVQNFSVAMATVASVIFFLALFWSRHSLASRKALFASLAVALLGLLLACLRFWVVDISQVAAAPPTGREIAVFNGCYIGAYVLLVGGFATLILHGFVCFQERQDTLAAAAPVLDKDEWESVERLVVGIVKLRDLTTHNEFPVALRKPVRSAVSIMLSDVGAWAEQLAQCRLQTRSARMHEIFELFSAQITTGLAAVSNQDFEFWKSPESKAYLDHNAKLAKAGRNVDRLFVVADGRPLSADEWTILETQIKSGIGVRVVRHGMANAVSNGQPLDFALLDDFGVTFWKGSYIRAFELALDRETVAKFKTHRDLLVGSAINDTNGHSFTDAAKLRFALQGNGLI